MTEVPIAKLGIERFLTNPPKPTGIVVIVEGQVVALVTLDEFDQAYKRLSDMRAEGRSNV